MQLQAMIAERGQGESENRAGPFVQNVDVEGRRSLFREKAVLLEGPGSAGSRSRGRWKGLTSSNGSSVMLDCGEKVGKKSRLARRKAAENLLLLPPLAPAPPSLDPKPSTTH